MRWWNYWNILIVKRILQPSLLAFDKTKIVELLKDVKAVGVKTIHYDVMDGKFVPETAYGTEWLNDIKKLSMKANVHFMVNDIEQYIKDFSKYPIDAITFNAEPCKSNDEIIKYLKMIKALKIKCGIAIKPSTSYDQYIDVYKYCDYLLVLSVEPGRGGQPFIPSSVEKLQQLNKIKNRKFKILLDGGVNSDVAKITKKYVDEFVSGSYFMKLNVDDKKKFIKLIE